MKIKYFLIMSVLVASLSIPMFVYAQESTTTTQQATTTESNATGTENINLNELPDVVITPASPLFFVKRIFEDIGTFFTFSKEGKVKRYMELADRRLAEAKKLADEGNGKAEKAVELYEKQIEKAKDRASSLNKEDLIDKVTEATNKHIDVLENVLEKVPDQAKPVIEKNIERAKERQQTLINRIKNTDPQKAGEFAADAMINRINSIRRIAKNATPEQIDKLESEVEKWKEYLDKLENSNPGLKEKISDRIDKILEYLDKLKENKDLDNLPEKARNGIENMRKNILENHLQTIRKLGDINPEKSLELINRAITRNQDIGGTKSVDELIHMRDEIFNKMEEKGINPEARDRLRDNFNRIINNKLNNSTTSFNSGASEGELPVEEKIKDRLETDIENSSSSENIHPLKKFEETVRKHRIERERERSLTD